jgi:glycosyltransferase involved in cell wall biosynthesis
MKIAIFHELPFGGARRGALEFGKELSKKNEVDLYYIDEKEEKNLNKYASNIKFIKFTAKKWKGNDWRSRIYKDSAELYKLYKLHKNLAKLIDNKKYDFVIVHASKYTESPFILRFLKTPSIYYCQEPLRMVYEDLFNDWDSLGIERKTYERLNKLIRKRIDIKNINKAHLVITTSVFIRNYVKKIYNIKAYVAYQGVDRKAFYISKSKKKYDLLFIGSKQELDGYSTFLKVLDKLNKKIKVRSVLIENEWIDKDSGMRNLYNESKILICLARKEPFGLMPLEAGACGTTTIAVDEGGYKETILDGKTGFLIKRDPEIIANKIEILLGNSQLIKKLSKNAFENVKEKWNWESNTENLLKTIKTNLN